MIKLPWPIKHRPNSIKDYLFNSAESKLQILDWIQNKYIPNLLLKGHRGIGKTTLAYILKEELGIEDTDFLKLNASKDNSVDIVRDKITNFVSTFSISPFKIVFLDEADYLSLNAQAALRSLMEEYAENVRFILTCNKPQKIIPELADRCHEINFKSLDKNDMLERAALILEKEKVKVADVDLLDDYIDASYPSFRKLLQKLESGARTGSLVAYHEGDEDITDWQVSLVGLIEKDDYMAIRTALANSVNDDGWEEVYRFLYDNIQELGKFNKDVLKLKQGIVIIADHLYRHAIVADPEINAAAMFVRLGDL